MRASSTPWLSMRTCVSPTRASASFRFATLTGATRGGTSATCPAPVGPPALFHKGHSIALQRSASELLMAGVHKLEQGGAGLGRGPAGPNPRWGPGGSAAMPGSQAKRVAVSQARQVAWHGVMDTQRTCQRRCHCVERKQRGSIRAHGASRESMEGSGWARYYPHLAPYSCSSFACSLSSPSLPTPYLDVP